MGGGAGLVPLWLLLQLVEVAAGPAAHLAAAPGAAVRPHCSGYVRTVAPHKEGRGSCSGESNVEGVLEKDHLSKHFPLLLFECLFILSAMLQVLF